ncbi:hypothetical protein GCM10008927_06190 [Amylibacter ulvae]|uniref:EBNA-1 nuclear protein n=1 Tax=Paramylibacter ulvae TaxID=1651968 RepID=A0ABQ3CU88_9RHOB|nr:DUF1611 domain-containing protein [Amylibacter ulvae]GHA44180.1 hypothetical protein GCM10008927_06190 [Amylibacter ulvae]
METEPKMAHSTQNNNCTTQALPPDQPLHSVLHSPAGIYSPPTAIIYCEGNFARIDGKTANGLIRHSQAYNIVSVIDSCHAGQDSGEILGMGANHIPIFQNLDAAIKHKAVMPDTLIYGMAPTTGKLTLADRRVILDAISRGMNIVSGLHEFLSEDAEISGCAKFMGTTIRDIRKPKASRDMRLFDGSIANVKALRIAVLGTDCAIGKRTTATILARVLNEKGIKTVLVGTGQTGLMQGAKYGVAMDAIPPQFCCGELEGAIVAASDCEQPDVILIEGQGALSHPAFCTSAFILRGSQPDAVILQHAPKRVHRCDFPNMSMPDPADEIALIESFANTKVIGLTINHENMTKSEVKQAITDYTLKLDMPVTDVLIYPPAHLLNVIVRAYPALRKIPLVAET